MRIYTGRGKLLETALLGALRQAVDGGGTAVIVVPKQLTLQTERMLLSALNLRGSFQLQVLSPERLCGRIFEAAGQPDGVRVDERGRVMLVRAAVKAVEPRLKLYRGAQNRRGFADRCARQLELIRQANLTPEALYACAGEVGGMLAMKLDDLGVILEAYEGLIEGRFQDGESEFNAAVERAKDAGFLRGAEVFFYGFDMTPPTLHALIGAIGAVCPGTHVFLPLENDPHARDFDAFLPMQACCDRLTLAARLAGAQVARVRVEPEDTRLMGAMCVPEPGQRSELARRSRELFAYPVSPAPADKAPGCVQLAQLRDPLEECRFAAALCRRLAMARGWRWSDMQILCRDIEGYRQPLNEAFRAYGVPVFLSSSRPAARHPLAECLVSALRMAEGGSIEDALALLRTGYMPLEADEADRLANHAVKYGLRPGMLLRPLRRGTEAEIQALEPVRERFAQPLNALKRRLKRSDGLRAQLSALFEFLTDIEAPARLQARLNALAEAGLRQQAGEEGQVWNRIVGALDQMAGLLGDAALPVAELRQTLWESLEAAVIKPLPQSGDAVYAQTTDRIVAQRAKALIILGETDRAQGDTDGLLNTAQLQAFSRIARAYLGPDDAELSRMRRFYLKSALEMASDYLCVCCPLSALDGAASRPGMLFDLVRGVFPALDVRGGVMGDDRIQWMLRASPEAAVSHAARALSAEAEGAPVPAFDTAALAGLRRLSDAQQPLKRALGRVRLALDHGASAERLSPATARDLYGALRRQSITRLERFAQCPFSYFAQYGLRPERVEPYRLNPRDEGDFFHDAVHEFLLASMDDLSRIDDAEAGRRMDAIADRLLDRMAQEGPLGDSAAALAERRRLKATARNCAGLLAEHMRGSRFSTAALETDFGVEDGEARLVVGAPGGECTLEGRIDRVDAWDEGGYLRVIDYKRGGKALKLDEAFYGLSRQLPVYLAAALKRRGGRSAGVYYFGLDEGIVALQSTSPAEVEQKRRSELKMTGLAVEDIEVLSAMSPNFSDVMNVRVTKDGALVKGAAVTDEAGFRALTQRALKKAGEHLEAIRGGLAAIAPAESRQQTPCRYCDWRAVCRFDARLDQGRVRRFVKMNAAEVMEALKLGKD